VKPLVVVQIMDGVPTVEVIKGKAEVIVWSWDVVEGGTRKEVLAAIREARKLPDTYAAKKAILYDMRESLKGTK